MGSKFQRVGCGGLLGLAALLWSAPVQAGWWLGYAECRGDVYSAIPQRLPTRYLIPIHMGLYATNHSECLRHLETQCRITLATYLTTQKPLIRGDVYSLHADFRICEPLSSDNSHSIPRVQPDVSPDVLNNFIIPEYESPSYAPVPEPLPVLPLAPAPKAGFWSRVLQSAGTLLRTGASFSKGLIFLVVPDEVIELYLPSEFPTYGPSAALDPHTGQPEQGNVGPQGWGDLRHFNTTVEWACSRRLIGGEDRAAELEFQVMVEEKTQLEDTQPAMAQVACSQKVLSK